jgi:hypothetical protein
MAHETDLVYRSRTFALVGWSMLALVVLAVATVIVDRPDPLAVWLGTALVVGAFVAWLVVRCYIAPRVVSDERGLRIVNPFGTTRLRWNEIERFEASPMLTVIRRDGSKVTAWAVQAGGTSRPVGRLGQSETVVAALTRQLAAATLPE